MKLLQGLLRFVGGIESITGCLGLSLEPSFVVAVARATTNRHEVERKSKQEDKESIAEDAKNNIHNSLQSRTCSSQPVGKGGKPTGGLWLLQP